MIELPHPQSIPQPPRLKILGVGGAGCAMLDRLVLDGLPGTNLIALNTDVQSLTGCVAGRQIALGPNVTRGLGTGGDPELGYAAAEESMAEISSALDGAELVLVIGGLGGGTASGAMPLIAHAARTEGARVIALATLPFTFEGKRRQAQAEESLRSLRETSDLLLCFENDRMAEIVSARAGIQEGFAAVDQTLSQCLRALSALTQRRGLLHAGWAEVAALFHHSDLRALFGSAQARGDNRCHEVVEALLKCPLLERGRRLKEVDAALVHIAGGPDLTLSEIETLMEGVRRHLPENAQLHLGLAVDAASAGVLSVSLLGALPTEQAASVPRPQPVLRRRPLPVAEPEPELETAPEPALPAAEAPEAEPASAEPAPRPRMRPLFAPVDNVRRGSPAAESEEGAKPREVKQEQMFFEPVNRGRFEKSEPTIIDGQDLDVPTFLRRNLRLGK